MPLTVKFRDIRKGHSLMFTGLGTSEGMEEEERELLFPLRVHRVLYSKDNGSIYMYYIILGGIPLRAICRPTLPFRLARFPFLWCAADVLGVVTLWSAHRQSVPRCDRVLC